MKWVFTTFRDALMKLSFAPNPEGNKGKFHHHTLGLWEMSSIIVFTQHDKKQL